MSNLADPLEQAVLEWMFHNTDMPSSASNVYVALHTGNPNSDGTAETEPADENEVTASDYERAAVGATTSNWDLDMTSQEASVITNDTTVSFGIAEADWGTVTHFSLWTGPLGDSDAIPFGSSTLDSSLDITTNDRVEYPSGEMTATLD